MRPGDPPTVDAAQSLLFQGMFFDGSKYDFSRVGRMKFNLKLGYYTKLKERLEGKTSTLRVGRGNRFPRMTSWSSLGRKKSGSGSAKGMSSSS